MRLGGDERQERQWVVRALRTHRLASVAQVRQAVMAPQMQFVLERHDSWR